MLHKNVIENKGGFRTLKGGEIDAVSGGRDGNSEEGHIFVSGSRGSGGGPVGGGGGGRAGGNAGGTPVSVEERMALYEDRLAAEEDRNQQEESGNVIIVEGDPNYDSSTFIPVFPFFIDTNEDDFKEFLVNEMDFSAFEAETETILEFAAGNQQYIVHFNGEGEGAVYVVINNIFTDDDFVFQYAIENVTFSSISQSQTTSISNNGGSISAGNGITITFDRAPHR